MWNEVNAKSTRVRLLDGNVRSVGMGMLHGRLNLAPMNDAQVEAWSEAAAFVVGIGPGEVANLGALPALVPVDADAQARAWLVSLGVDVDSTKASTLICLGSSYHHDASDYPGEVFCVVWLDEASGWDLVFPHISQRVPLEYGTIVLFDSAQPHGVLRQGAKVFDPDHEAYQKMGTFLSYDLSVWDYKVAAALGISFVEGGTQNNGITLNSPNFKDELDLDDGQWWAKAMP